MMTFGQNFIFGEIPLKNSKGDSYLSKSKEPLSKSEALIKLQDAKQMLELGVISQKEYNILLEELKPILKN
jgi:hypothetical protein